MKEIKIALLQIMPGNNIDENLEIGIRACRKAKKMEQILYYFLKCGVMAIKWSMM